MAARNDPNQASSSGTKIKHRCSVTKMSIDKLSDQEVSAVVLPEHFSINAVQETALTGSKPEEPEEPEVPEVKNMRYWANKISHVFKKVRHPKKRRGSSFGSLFSSIDSQLEDLDADHSHYKPEAIDTLCQLTKFNRRELQLMYRGFKQECPNGMVKEETFKGIYAQYFPKGAETAQYAHYVFNSFDHDNTGSITFTDFVIGLSVLARGSLQEKLRWAFSLYDINGDGYITKDEMSRIVQSIYELMGKAVEPMMEEHTTRDHVDRVFQKLDLNKDGVVTIDEFLDSCQRDENITRNMSVFNTIL